jgi:hypothetical protein
MHGDNIEIYKIWAPDTSEWSAWAKPVLFASAPFQWNDTKPGKYDIQWLQTTERQSAIVVDLPAEQGVYEGLALAQLGYRPVPLYNGVCDAQNSNKMIVSVNGILMALFRGAGLLKDIRLPDDALPAFLLDSNRMRGAAKEPGKFDNRWSVFPQDMPSAALLQSKMITQIIVRTDERFISDDLRHILYRYQQAGIRIFKSGRSSQPEAVTVSRPSGFGGLFYRISVILGLKRNAAGGFGGIIPEPSSSGGGRYHRMG